MALVDQTNSEIILSLHPNKVRTPEKSMLEIDADFDSALTPTDWVWFMFYTTDNETKGSPDEDWFMLTYEEAEQAYDRLGRILGKKVDAES